MRTLIRLAFVFALVGPYFGRMPAAQAAGWRNVVTYDDVVLSTVEQYEEAPGGALAYVYFRLQNKSTHRVSASVHAEVRCGPSGNIVAVDLNIAPEDIGAIATPPSSIPYFAQLVCAPGERIDDVSAQLGVDVLPPSAAPASVEQTGLGPPPPPPGYGLPPVERRVRALHPGDIHSVGWLVQLDYGLSSFWAPVRTTVINSDGVTGFAEARSSGGLGPRLGLTYFPYLSRHMGLGIGGFIEGGAMGLSNGYTDGTQARVDLSAEYGDRLFLSGVAKASFGYRFAENHSSDAFDPGHADASVATTLSRVTALVRMCTEAQNTLPFCRMGFDAGVAFEMPNYARARAGGLLLQGNFWLHRVLSVQLEGGWSYPIGGRSTPGIPQASDDGRSGFFEVAFVFTDDFLGLYNAPQ
jgi:hypothetical protein